MANVGAPGQRPRREVSGMRGGSSATRNGKASAVVGLGIGAVAVAAAITIYLLLAAEPAATLDVKPLSPALESALAGEGIEVDPSSAAAKVTAERAWEVAAAELPALTSEADPQVSLVSFTDATLGEETADGSLDIAYEDRVAWAVVLTDVEVPLFGPAVEDRKMETYPATLVTFVDAESGEFLEAIAVSE